MALILFFSTFALYLYSCAPTLAPYRDAGEMVVLLKTLGVAHPPGYALYTLAGQMIHAIPFGNDAYRANVFSALCAAGAISLFFHVFWEKIGRSAAFLAALFLSVSFVFWELAAVSEMYAMGFFWVVLMLWALITLKNVYLFSFLAALGLGVRMDLLLLLPVFGIWLLIKKERFHMGLALFCFTLGLTVFLYLMVRSLQNPWLDWSNPDNFTALFNSLRRKSYSGTLDLLSLSYGNGENFLVNMKLYAEHLLKAFGWIGVLLLLLGFLRAGWLFNVCFLVTGPLFLFLANMPPNPHAVAIIEASYGLPDVFGAILIGFGLTCVFVIARERSDRSNLPFQIGNGRLLRFARNDIFFLGTGFVFIGINAFSSYERTVKRHNFYARDYVENVWRSTPEKSVVVFHKDVQLFSLWESQLVQKKRPDVALITTGLSASPWYHEMRKRWPTAQAPQISLKEAAGWLTMRDHVKPRGFFVGQETDVLAADRMSLRGHGLLMKISTSDQDPVLLPTFSVHRGVYRTDEAPDFFSSDLVGDTARACHREALDALNVKNYREAEFQLKRAAAMDPLFPRASADLGYLYFVQNDYKKAAEKYSEAISIYEKMLGLAAAYKSLPDVVTSFKRDMSSTCLNWGAALERLGDTSAARAIYEKAVSVYPNAQAYYNIAVTYWDKDWMLVIQNLENALRINPDFGDAQKYLFQARARLRQS